MATGFEAPTHRVKLQYTHSGWVSGERFGGEGVHRVQTKLSGSCHDDVEAVKMALFSFQRIGERGQNSASGRERTRRGVRLKQQAYRVPRENASESKRAAGTTPNNSFAVWCVRATTERAVGVYY